MTQSNHIFPDTQAKTLAFGMVQVFVLPQNSYVEIPGPNVMALVAGLLRDDQFMSALMT